MENLTQAVEQPSKSLTAADRCDLCGAQAFVHVELSTGELFFCAHHANERKAELSPIAKSWHDESAKLLIR
ncbi:DUF7455 domain-containing protein [Candidatus Rhodoluna planktonica]|uniref:DUF7455 domain-containing protein n=1 Tax=Candidatus Rhodoluna planktonica TaxID=535712 RepID=UPI0009FE12A7|nr:hypothetical protein [Candidatus Rhodoluna planktonica]